MRDGVDEGRAVVLYAGAMHELVAVALPAGPSFVDVLDRVWADGDAVLPVDLRLPPPGRAALFEAMGPSRLIEGEGEDHGHESELDGGYPTEDGDALVVPTSGSTGRPKGVVHTHDSLQASARSTSRALDVDPQRDAWLCCLPLSHIAGLAVILRAKWAGIPLEIHPRFDATAVQAAARERGATLTSLVPTALARIDPSLFRRIIVGGSAPPTDRPANTVASYGMTETGSAVVFDGWPLDDVELRIVDGEIQVRGPMVLRAYRDGTDPRTPEGWLPTGDAGSLDADGRLEVQGRRGDLIITGGENVWPAPVERILAARPEVAEVAVVGRPDPEWGQVVTAIVVPTDAATPPSLDALRQAVKEQLHPYAAPRRLELVASLPRSSLGKVLRSQL